MRTAAALLAVGLVATRALYAQGGERLPPREECAAPAASWLFCDDFEVDRLGRYFEVNTADGRFAREAGAGVHGSHAMRGRWRPGDVNAGALRLAFGRTPQRYMRPADDGTRDHRELYWRFWLRLEPGWTGGGADKLARATVFAADSWAQAMIAHLWSSIRENGELLLLEPASGIDQAGRLRATAYNDFPNLRWIGARRGTTRVFADARAGRWTCFEARVRLNSPGQRDGVFEAWIDDRFEAGRQDLDWVGTWSGFGLNGVFLENWQNAGSRTAKSRSFDNLVVSTQRIGCGVAR